MQTIIFKTPDVLCEIEQQIKEIEKEQEFRLDDTYRQDELKELNLSIEIATKFIKYGELMKVNINTQTGKLEIVGF